MVGDRDRAANREALYPGVLNLVFSRLSSAPSWIGARSRTTPRQICGKMLTARRNVVPKFQVECVCMHARIYIMRMRMLEGIRIGIWYGHGHATWHLHWHAHRWRVFQFIGMDKGEGVRHASGY